MKNTPAPRNAVWPHITLKSFALLMLLLLNTNKVVAQDLWKAKVKLYKSPTLTGYVSIPQTGESIYLQQSDSTRVLLELEDIKKLKLLNPYNNKSEAFKTDYKTFSSETGFYHQLFVGVSFGEEELNGSMGIINGYRFNNFFALDIGINYDRYKNISTLPIYLQPRLYLKNNKISIYYFTGVGYSLGWTNKEQNNANEKIDVQGGVMGQAGIGYQINFLKSALNFTLGYKLQKVVTDYEYYSTWYERWPSFESVKAMDVEEKRLVRRIFFTVGYTL